MAKRIIWFWFIFLLVLNLVPLGASAQELLSKNLLEGWDFFRLDYLAHFAAFLAFSLIFSWGQYVQAPVFKERALLKFTMLVMPAAILFEGMQYLMPCRKFNPIDMIYNLAGALLGCLIVFITLRFRPSA